MRCKQNALRLPGLSRLNPRTAGMGVILSSYSSPSNSAVDKIALGEGGYDNHKVLALVFRAAADFDGRCQRSTR